MSHFSIKPFMALSIGLTFTSTLLLPAQIFANSTTPLQGDLGELPNLTTHSVMHYGSFGPQNNLSDPDFKSIPLPVYLDKAFDELAVGSVFQVNKINYIFNNIRHEKNYTTTVNKSLTQDDALAIVKDRLKEIDSDSGLLCDAAVSWDKTNNELSVEVTPLVLNSIDITAKDHWQEKVLRHLLRVPTGQVLDLDNLKSQLRLIQNNPDIALSPELEVVPYSHSVNFKLDAPEHKSPVHVISSFSNLDQSAYGEELLNASLITNNVTGHGDSLMISPSFGMRSQGFQAFYELPITARFRSFIDVQWGHFHPFSNASDGYSYNGFASKITPGIKYTFFDRSNKRASVDLQMDFKQGATNSNNDKLERESIRDLRMGVQYDQQWEKTTLSVRNEVAAAFDILGARASFAPFQPIPNAGSQFVRTTGFMTLTRNLPLDSSLVLNTSWQYSPDTLPMYEQFCGGGTFAGRGYREVFICGDSGALASVQWQAPAFFLPKAVKLPMDSVPLREKLQFLTFLDSGYLYYNNFASGTDPSDFYLSTGAGFRLQLTPKISGRLDIGFPLLRNVPYANNPRFHFGVDVIAF